jgi:hypothetical protein
MTTIVIVLLILVLLAILLSYVPKISEPIRAIATRCPALAMRT